MPRPYGEVKVWRAQHPDRWLAQKRRYYHQFAKNASSRREGWDRREVMLILAPDRPPDRELSVLLKRTVQSIQVKRAKVRKENPQRSGERRTKKGDRIDHGRGA